MELILKQGVGVSTQLIKMKNIFIFLIVLSLFPLVSAFDQQLPQNCGGDSGLLMDCFGDEGLLFLEGMPSPAITPPSSELTEGNRPESEIKSKEEQPMKFLLGLFSIFGFDKLSEDAQLVTEILLTVFIMFVIAFGYIRMKKRS